MQFLDAFGCLIAEYSSDLPPNYLNFRMGLEIWLKQHERFLGDTHRCVIITAWVYDYLRRKSDLQALLPLALVPIVERPNLCRAR